MPQLTDRAPRILAQKTNQPLTYQHWNEQTSEQEHMKVDKTLLF